ncbi:DUF6695 family protein [Bacteroidota bacterium]
MIKLPHTLLAPKHPSNLPQTAKWLSGEGAGSWFVIVGSDNDLLYKISRFSPLGILECYGTFTSDKKVYLGQDYSITYPSHCAKITILQGKHIITCKLYIGDV